MIEGRSPIPFIGTATSRAEALSSLRRAFGEAGLDDPALDARVLVLAALQIEPMALAAHPELPVGAAEVTRLSGFAARRLRREPIARILGRREFWGLHFELSPETLVPRPDTETVIETALRHLRVPGAGGRILDLGTGSGCLLVALLHELPQATGIGIDCSSCTLAVARRNAVGNGVGARAAFVVSDWAAALGNRFDLIVANPPYIASNALPSLPPEVRHDPRVALDGGLDGLDAYRRILGDAGRLLAERGLMVLEIGYDQERPLRALAAGAGYVVIEVAPDLGGRPRAIALTRPSA